MSLSHKTHYSDEQLARYLLQRLPEDEMERLDEMSIADDEIAWRLRVVEDDLVDAYVNGSLTGETLKEFEAVYLSSERRRRKVQFAGNFLAKVDRGMGAPKVARRGWTVPQATPVWCLAAAAALLLVCGALAVRYVQLQTVLSEAQGQSAALERRSRELEQQLDSQRAAAADTASELARVRAEIAQLQATSARPANPPGGAPQPLAAIALVLLPQTRAVGDIPTLVVPHASSRVTVDLRLDSNRFGRYEAVLKDPASNVIVWRSRSLAATSAAGQRSVKVEVPPGILKAQHYSIELIGDGSSEVADTYALRVVFQ